ncbi:hypothetical protein NQD34_007449 [Periophthalmus magnuspinnatus]|nr:hypothetical protein NQD34_007449 [Periophthalmus magnuspinnatus]
MRQVMETGQKQALFPWYKERLQTKYLKPSTSGFPSLHWYKATDDSSSAPSWAHVGISPVTFTTNLKHHCIFTSTQMPKQAVSMKHACFSRQMVQKQRRREYVAAVEDELRQPLAQYQQYKDYMSPEVRQIKTKYIFILYNICLKKCFSL